MNVLGKRIRDVYESEQMGSLEALKIGGLKLQKTKIDKKLIQVKKRRITMEKRLNKKKERLQKAEGVVNSLKLEIEDMKSKFEDKDEEDKLHKLVEDIDLEIDEYDRKVYKLTQPLVESFYEDLGIVFESDHDCGICYDTWPYVVNVCVSENCKALMCLKCLEKCKGKCPYCRGSIKK